MLTMGALATRGSEGMLAAVQDERRSITDLMQISLFIPYTF